MSRSYGLAGGGLDFKQCHGRPESPHTTSSMIPGLMPVREESLSSNLGSPLSSETGSNSMSQLGNYSSVSSVKAPPLTTSAAEKSNTKPGAHEFGQCKGAHAGYHNPKDKKQSPWRPVEIMIAPGFYARLRGADETWHAMQNNLIVSTACVVCTEHVCCIKDAQYILCPTCRVVSPLHDGIYNAHGGVGLGFTMADLGRWKQELERR